MPEYVSTGGNWRGKQPDIVKPIAKKVVEAPIKEEIKEVVVEAPVKKKRGRPPKIKQTD